MDVVSETIKTYDQTAVKYKKRYEKYRDQNQMKEILDKFLSMLKTDKKVLDIGSGPGFDAKYLSERGCDVTGIDMSRKLIKVAQNIAPKAKFLEMDMRAMTFHTSHFDGIWACSSLLHLPKKEISEVLKNITKIMTPAGVAFIGLKQGMGERFVTEDRKDNNTPKTRRFFAFYEKEEVNKLLTEAGLRLIDYSVYGSGINTWMRFLCVKQ